MVALLVLAGCGNPFTGTTTSGGGIANTSVNTLGDNLAGTANPTATSAISRGEAVDTGPNKTTVKGNGYAVGYQLNADGTFTVDGLAFDGGNVYARDAVMPTVGPAKAFEAATTYNDSVTGAQIDQFSYRALYGVSKTGRTQFAIVRTGSYRNYGFGGFIFSRTDGTGALPTSGQAQYLGTYAGLRDSSAGGLQYTTGDMKMEINFAGFDANRSATGNGAGIKGQVTNRQVFDLNGNNVTAAVVALINADHTTQVTPLTALPTMVFDVGPGVLDNNGEAQGGLSSSINTLTDGTRPVLESGKYYAVISGDVKAGTDEVAGVFVVNSQVNKIDTRETGGFILYRPGP